MSRYSFIESDTSWESEFAAESSRLHSMLPDCLQAVHHIGSTAVRGLAAKPIIDLLPVLHEASQLDQLQKVLEPAGYIGRGELGLPGRRFFFRDQDGLRTHNLHFYAVGHPDIERHLAFRDYLRAHLQVAHEYEVLKRAGFALHPDNIAAYNDHKDDWIKALEPVAIRWKRLSQSAAADQI